MIGITIARTGLPLGDITHDGAGITTDFFIIFFHSAALFWDDIAIIAASTRCGVAGVSDNLAPPVAWLMALRMAGAVGIKTCSPNPLTPIGPSGSVTSIR